MEIVKSVDVLIPVYKPDVRLEKIIERLYRQTYPVNRIRLINTERRYFEQAYPGNELLLRYPDVEVKHIAAEEFDHGATRRALVEMSDSEYFVFMTDDALPADAHLIERLLKPLLDGEAVVSYARQLPRADLKETERYVRRFNYPEQSRIKTKADMETMGIKAFFCPNVCAAYQRKAYETLDGFENRAIFNEDMIFARKVLDAGKGIAYVADARVIHSHNYSEGEGIRMLRSTSGYLLRKGKIAEIFELFAVSVCKYMGYKLGKNYQKLPETLVKQLTMNKNFWKS